MNEVIDLEPRRWYRIEAELREIYGNPEIFDVPYLRVYGDKEVGLLTSLRNDQLVFTEKSNPEIKSRLIKLATKL